MGKMTEELSAAGCQQLRLSKSLPAASSTHCTPTHIRPVPTRPTPDPPCRAVPLLLSKALGTEQLMVGGAQRGSLRLQRSHSGSGGGGRQLRLAAQRVLAGGPHLSGLQEDEA